MYRLLFVFSVSGPVSCPDVLVSARVRKTRDDTAQGIRGQYELRLIQSSFNYRPGEAHQDWLKLGGDMKFYLLPSNGGDMKFYLSPPCIPHFISNYIPLYLSEPVFLISLLGEM